MHIDRLRLAHATTLIGFFGLLILILAWNTWLSPPTVLPVAVVLVLFVGPLMFPLRGLLHGKLYTHKWTSFLTLFYFLHGVVESYSNPAERMLAIMEIVFSVILYLGCIFYVRFYQASDASRA